MVNPEILDFVQNFFSDPNSEKSKRANIAYNRARGLGEGEDYAKASNLFARRLKTEVEQEEVAKLREYINLRFEETAGNIDTEELVEMGRAITMLSEDLGRDLGGIETESMEGDKHKLLGTEGLTNTLEQIRREHSTIASEIDETVSPQMAQRLGHSYRALGEQERQRAMKTAPTKQLVRGLVRSGNQEDLDRVLQESGQKAPGGFARSARRWSGGDEGDLYQESAEKVAETEQELFRQKLEEVALEKARERSAQVEAEYKKRAEEQGEILARWQGDEEAYLGDLRTLREKGFLGAEEAASYATNREETANSPQGNTLAADVVTATRMEEDRAAGTAFGYPVDPQQEQQGGGMPLGLGGAAGAAGKAGSLLGDSRAGQMAGRLVNSGALRALGPAALGFAGLSATADLSMMRGHTGAASTTNAATSVLPGLGGLAGSLGGPVGAAVGLGLGYGASKTIGAVARPYQDFVGQQKGYETISGSNLQGEGASQSGLEDLLRVAVPGVGGNTIQERTNMARLQNPFLDPAQIEALTTNLLELGESVESTASVVGDLSGVMGDFNISAELTAQLYKAGSTGSLGGVETARHVATQLQAQSGHGFTQENISGYVSEAVNTLGPVSGYARAPESALAYSGLMSRGDNESDMLFQSSQTVGSMIRSDAAVMQDPMAMAMMGLDPSLSPEQQDPGALAAGRIEQAKQLGNMVERGPDGKLSTNGLYQLQMALQMEPWATTFAGMGVQEVGEMITNPNITPDNARKEFDAQEKARKRKEKEQTLRAKGIGSEKKWGTPGFFETDVKRGIEWGQGDAARLYDKSEDQAKGIGAVGQLMSQNRDIDLENVRLAGGGTLADAQDDLDLLKRLNRGKQKLRVGGKNLTVADYNLADLRGQAFLGSKGGINLGEPGKGEKAGYKAEIDLSERASKYFSIKDVRDEQGAAGATTQSQHAHATNTGKKRLNDAAIYGGGN